MAQKMLLEMVTMIHTDSNFYSANAIPFFTPLAYEDKAFIFGGTADAEPDNLSDYQFITVGSEEIWNDQDGDGIDDDYDSDFNDEYEFDENESKYINEKPNQDEDEYYEEFDIEYVGNAFQQGDTVVMSTGGGSIDQWDLEDALGLKDGQLDEAIFDSDGNVAKNAIDATHGSGAYDTVQLNAGDVISFGFTFGTNDYIPYQDFAFFAFNGKTSSIATVGDNVDSYGEISDVFNYVVTEDDLGGSSGIVKVGVGIVDAYDTCVDSYLEVYDFEVSGDEKYLDSGNDGIVEGESSYTISTASIGTFSVASTPTVKLSLKGKSITAETSDKYDVVASAASEVISGGYQVLLEGTGKKAGKWFVHQTDANGAIKQNKKSGWKSTNKAVALGWEQLFNKDLNGDAVLEGTADNDTFTLYSAKTGGVALSLSSVSYDAEGAVEFETDAEGAFVLDAEGEKLEGY